MQRTTGHLLFPISVRNPDDNPCAHWITPATFFPNGLAVHRSTSDDGYSVTHVRSGSMLRNRLTRPVAYRLATALVSEDWTFPASAVTQQHADRIRQLVGD